MSQSGCSGYPWHSTVWLTSVQGRAYSGWSHCAHVICEGRQDTLDTEKVFPSGVAVTVRQISGTDDMAQPRLAAYQDSVVAVGGQDPNTKKCLVYDMLPRSG